MIKSLIISLLLTLIIELFVSFLLGIRNKHDIKIVVCANVCTNLIFVYILSCVLLFNNIVLFYSLYTILELIVLFVEFIIYKKCFNFNKLHPFVISLVNNAVSLGIGLIISFIL